MSPKVPGLSWRFGSSVVLTLTPAPNLLLHGPITLTTEFHQGQAYACSDYKLLSRHYIYFLVMTGHYEIFSRLDCSFELWVKLCARGRKQQKRWTKYNYIFNNWKKNYHTDTSLVWATKKAVARASGCGKLLPVFLLHSF